MKVRDNRRQSHLKDIQDGDVFMSGNDLYIKTQQTDVDEGRLLILCVCLESGYCTFLSELFIVEPVCAEIIIK